MRTHTDLVKRLRQAAAEGQDLLPLIQAEHDHLATCATCRAALSRFVVETQGRGAAVDLALAWLEQQEQLEEPPSYPTFDLSFLPASAAPASAGTASSGLWSSSQVVLPGGVRQQVRELAAAGLHVRVATTARTAAFHGLSAELSSSRGRVQSGRGRAVSRGERLTLPDPEANLEIRVRVEGAGSGRSDVTLELRPLATGEAAVEAQVRLSQATGAETRSTRGGTLQFVDLVPDRYVIEITPQRPEKSETVWRVTLELEQA